MFIGIALVVGIAGKFLTNFFTEDTTNAEANK
jgi:hypothetical protein